jgi:hypothetical protein
MQFNHPEVLYALFLLIIPIIVHLFQLRKFQKESFTNVKFLKRLTQQTRKSSELKKWVVLATRLLLLTCIILAFAQPYFPDKNQELGGIETVIYLDNSYSMQADGRSGRLFERSVQELLENLPEDHQFSLHTNTEEFPAIKKQDLQNHEYSAIQPDLKTILLKAESKFSHDPEVQKKLLLISDFQKGYSIPEDLDLSNIEIFALQMEPVRLDNIRIDSAYVFREAAGDEKLAVKVTASGNAENTSVSLFNNSNLIGKTGVDFSENLSQEVVFPLEEQGSIIGVITIEDNGLSFDNELFFSVKQAEPINVSSINAAEDEFLQRIFTAPEFNYKSFPETGVDYNALAASEVIILNETRDLSNSLLTSLQQKKSENSIFIVIPSEEEPGSNLKIFIRELGINAFENRQVQEKRITDISFEHPLFDGVFEEEISNFEYPKVQTSYRINAPESSVIRYQDRQAFLLESGGNYFFSAPLNSENSNFTRSPLVVPTFYNIGISALQPSKLYYSLGKTNNIDVPVSTRNDEILQITSGNTGFIPQQQRFSNKVELTTNDLPLIAGNFEITLNGQRIMPVSYNLDRKESILEYLDLEQVSNIEIVETIPDFISSEGYIKEADLLWKWFVTFAILFLIIETLLLKYFK